MMNSTENHSKITPAHLQRNAYLYIRQSTMKQVLENTESTKRQYALRQKGISLGWLTEQIIVIDTDQGQSGAQAADRIGFQRLVTEVSLGHAGIVMGLEVSRLARNSMDWHRLLEICALTNTLILDEEGIYDPGHFNDRLLLGLKGTMSEAELHVLKARLRGGSINKAKRGELRLPLPIGFIYDPHAKVIRDPNQQIQQTIQKFFDTFRQTGTACATVKTFHKQKLLFPRLIRSGINKGDIVWGELTHSHTLHTLHNPRYAGTYVFGRMRTLRQLDGSCRHQKIAKEHWQVVLPNAHEGYITWEEYEANLKQLNNNAQALGSDRHKSPPREGPALLQGLVICGRCGQRMTIRYHVRKGQLVPDYVCQRDGIEQGKKICQSIKGKMVDQTTGELLVAMVNPLSLDVAIAVQQELEARFSQTKALYQQQVEAARYEADLARRRYRKVDPDNRLVASTLEAEWNEKLRLLEQAQKNYDEQEKKTQQLLSSDQKKAILDLASDFPKLWCSKKTSDQERKKITRLLIEDVTLLQDKQITLHIRFKGGTTKTIVISRPLPWMEARTTAKNIVEKIDRLLDSHTDAEVANELNKEGIKSADGLLFTNLRIKYIRGAYSLKSYYERARARGLLTANEIAKMIGTCANTVRRWHQEGRLKGYVCTDRGEYLFEPLSPIMKAKLRKMKWSHQGH